MDNKKNGIPKLRFPGFTGAWEQRKLGDLAEIVRGASPRPISDPKWFDDNSDIGWLRISDVTNQNGRIYYLEQHISKLGQEKTRVITEPHLLLSIAATVGKPLINYIKTGVHDGFLIFLNPKFDLEYMYQWLEMFRPKWNKYGQPGSQVNLNSNLVRKQKIALPSREEQQRISSFLKQLDSLIALHQRKLEHLQEQKKGLLQKMFPKNGETVPEVRFPGFTDAWEQRKLGEEFKRVNERNNGEFGKDRWISVAKMYFQDPDKVTSNNIDTRTYVMRFGDIAFEGHPNNEFKFGRFVANDIGDGVVSELFPIYRHIRDYDNNYWKYAIHLERIMGPIFAKSITSSGNSSNKLAPKDLLRQSIFLPHLDEQKEIGNFLKKMDSLITLHQRKLEHLELMKKGLLQQMFV